VHVHQVRATRVASKSGGLNIKKYLQPRKRARIEVAVRIMANCRLRNSGRKVDALKEEMRERTSKRAGVGDQTS
jgi:hypothetical protein